MTSMLVEYDTFSEPTYRLAIETIEKMMKAPDSNKAFGYHMMAMGYSRVKDFDKAVENQEKAVEALKSFDGATGADRRDFAAKLAQYEAAKEKAAAEGK